MSKSKNVFITGGYRGIGLGLVEAILKQFKPDNLFATYRDVATAQKLQALAAANPSLHLVQLDVRDDEAKIKKVVQFVDEKTKGAGLNLLINNSGILKNKTGGSSLSNVTKEEMLESFEINSIGPVIIAKLFLPLLEKASSSPAGQSAKPGIARAAIVNISSIAGSISLNEGGFYSYGPSKTALNMATVSMSIDLKKSKIIAVVLHPGWVKTDMGGSGAEITVSESVTGLMNVIGSLDESKSGKFYDWKGKVIAW